MIKAVSKQARLESIMSDTLSFLGIRKKSEHDGKEPFVRHLSGMIIYILLLECYYYLMRKRISLPWNGPLKDISVAYRDGNS